MMDIQQAITYNTKEDFWEDKMQEDIANYGRDGLIVGKIVRQDIFVIVYFVEDK